jgi:two-component system response regulator PilR (NtrC family)
MRSGMSDRPRVLLVDDERLMRLAVGHRLAHEGFLVNHVSSAGEALEILEKEVFDLVVTDLRFDGATGLEVVRAAKRLQPQAAVILLTGSADSDELHEAVHAGAAAVLVKPCALADLSREARKVVRRKSPSGLFRS